MAECSLSERCAKAGKEIQSKEAMFSDTEKKRPAREFPVLFWFGFSSLCEKVVRGVSAWPLLHV